MSSKSLEPTHVTKDIGLSTIPNIMNYNGQIVTGPELADCFTEFFMRLGTSNWCIFTVLEFHSMRVISHYLRDIQAQVIGECRVIFE